jgi:hypothetical protein
VSPVWPQTGDGRGSASLGGLPQLDNLGIRLVTLLTVRLGRSFRGGSSVLRQFKFPGLAHIEPARLADRFALDLDRDPDLLLTGASGSGPRCFSPSGPATLVCDVERFLEHAVDGHPVCGVIGRAMQAAIQVVGDRMFPGIFLVTRLLLLFGGSSCVGVLLREPPRRSLQVFLGLFAFHKSIVLNEPNLFFHQGFAVINAFLLAKVMFTGETFHVADKLKDKPLIYPILFKSTVFSTLLTGFYIIEEVIIWKWHGKTFSDSIPVIDGGVWREYWLSELSCLSV